jgi:hypothetical protein
VELLRPARRLLFITGAGLSADSGLPTYRGPGGLYDAWRTTPYGLPVEEVLSGVMLAARPEITWQSLLELKRPTRAAVPNRGHQVIAEGERRVSKLLPGRFGRSHRSAQHPVFPDGVALATFTQSNRVAATSPSESIAARGAMDQTQGWAWGSFL